MQVSTATSRTPPSLASERECPHQRLSIASENPDRQLSLCSCRHSSHRLARVGVVPEAANCSCRETRPSSGIQRQLVGPLRPSNRPAREYRPGTGAVVCSRRLPDKQTRSRKLARAVSTPACHLRGLLPAWRVSKEARKLGRSYPVEIRDPVHRRADSPRCRTLLLP